MEGQTQRSEPSSAAAERLRSTTNWQAIEERFFATGRAFDVLSGLTRIADEIVVDAWRAAVERLLPHSAALLAVGAYGRGETFPFSGADIVILLDTARESEVIKNPLAVFTRLLWDAGLRLNCAARTVAECLDAQNLDLTINLLDRRFLAGDRAVAARLDSKLSGVLEHHAHNIRYQLCRAARSRHARYQNTSAHLAPDVKEAPGGLRDLHLIDRLGKLHVEGEVPAAKIADARERIALTRCFLHYHYGRDQNLFDAEAAAAFARESFAGGATPAECLRAYLRQARLVSCEARRSLDAAERSQAGLLENLREYRTRLSNDDFTVSRERLLLRNPAQVERDPEMVCRLFEFVARHGIAPAPETERRLESAVLSLASKWPAAGDLWPWLKAVLLGTHAGAALRAMEATGLLPAILPEWSHIQDLPVLDEEHRFTADERTLASVERVAALRSNQDTARQRFADLFAELDSPAVLMAALLFLNLGMDDPDPMHAGLDRARGAMARLRVPENERAGIDFLVASRNELSGAIAGRDLEDPAVAHSLATWIGTIERLRLLVLVTFAGIPDDDSGVVAGWKLEQLWRAYSMIRQELTRELETDRILAVPDNLPERAEFVKGFPMRYLRAHSNSEIERHLRLFEASRPTGVAVQIDTIEGAYRLTVVARDRAYLFASFAGAISSFGLNILKAEAFANSRGVVLDTFVFADPNRMLQQNPSEMERLQDLLQRVALGRTDARRLMRSRPQGDAKKPVRPPDVGFDSAACETATLVEINAEDRPGLLYSLATVFSSNNCNIDVVLIDTKGHRAIDVFYVAYEGSKLSTELQETLKEKLLAAC